MKLAIKDSEGNVFTNDMTDDNAIIEVHFCTSYTQVVVQSTDINSEGRPYYPTKDLFIENTASPDDLAKAIDFMAVPSGSIGEWIPQ